MLQINYPVKKKQNQVGRPKPSTGLTIPSPVHYTGKRNVELKRVQDPLRNHRMPFRIWHAGLLFNTEAGWVFLVWVLVFCFCFSKPCFFFFQVVWNLELNQNKTCFVSMPQTTTTEPQADSGFSTDRVSLFSSCPCTLPPRTKRQW